MKQCPKCGKMHDDAVMFCDICGTQMGVQTAPAYAAPPAYNAPAYNTPPAYGAPYTPAYGAAPAAAKPIPVKTGVGTTGFIMALVSMGIAFLGLILILSVKGSIQRDIWSAYSRASSLQSTYNWGVGLSIFGYILSIPALVCSIVGVAKRAQKKALPIVGLILSVCVLFVLIIAIAVAAEM